MRTDVIVAGSRSIDQYDAVAHCIEDVLGTVELREDYHILTGTADGVDTLAEEWAVENDVPFTRYPADWDRYGKGAGPMRNQEMAEDADVLIAVWDGASAGTENMIDCALREKLEVHVYQKQGLAQYQL